MRKLTILMTFLLFVGFQAAAQMEISGKVTNSETGEPIPGVSVVVKGNTTIGTATDMDGNYTLSGVPSDAEALVYTFVGMQKTEVAIQGRTTIDVAMKPAVEEMEEVVVTALGISREKKALGYSVEDVSGDDITAGAETNMVNALKGKVAGVQVSSANAIGGSSRVLLRGVSSVDGNNNPLYVVDGVPIDNSNYTTVNQARGSGGYDYGNMAQDINPNDIKSISILKGASATALYGSRASNGVILIETKSGEKREGIGITWNSNVTMETVGRLPNYQNQYGGGDGPFGTVTVDGQTYQTVFYAKDESWGPELKGQEVVHWNNVYDWEQGITNELQTRPWEANPDNIRNFFETGVAFRNNIAFSGGNEDGTFRVSYTNLDRSGIYPNSEVNNNNVNIKSSYNFTDNLTLNASVNYKNHYAKALPGTGYSEENITQKFTQWGQRQWDMSIMEEYQNPDGTQRTWNRTSFYDPSPKYADNPYWTQNMNFPENWRNRVYGNISLDYNITDNLMVHGAMKTDYYTDRREEKRAVYSHDISFYEEQVREFQENNYEIQLRYNKDISSDLALRAMVGANRRDNNYKFTMGETVGGLATPGLYSVANSVSSPNTDDYFEEKRVNSVYGNVSLEYMSTYYLDFSLRNDWSSTLPEGDNSYMYPSVSGNVIFTEYDFMKNLSWFSFGKIRASWAQVGSDTDPYQLQLGYNPQNSFGSMPRVTLPANLTNPELKPETSTTIEFGTDLRFFDNRVRLDVTYYDTRVTDQIIQLDLSSSTGYNSKIVNAGEIKNTGLELVLDVTPVKTDNFTWNFSANWSKNTNEVVELAEGLDNYHLANGPFSVSVNARVGEPYGTIVGSGFMYDDEGNKIMTGPGGMYASMNPKILGSYLPDWTGGISNTLSYKGLSLGFTIDVREGGKLFSTSHMWGTYSGMLERTVENNIREDGIVLEGVVPDGSGGYVENTDPTNVRTWGLNHYFNSEMNVFDADYWKLREIRLSYTLPNSLFANLPFQDITVGLTANNVFMWGTDTENFDPEHVTNSGNIQGIEGSQLPPTRTFGFNLSVKL
jgi:TonB-linked SusC/RagA family outer membrane protein